MIKIESLHNNSVKALLKLKKAGERRLSGRFFVDGAREISLALKYGWVVREFYYCPELDVKACDLKNRLADLDKAIPVFSVSKKVFLKIAYKENPDGFLAVLEQRNCKLADFAPPLSPRILILEQVEKPGNLGAVIRTVAAAGFTALILNDNKVDLYNPNVIRASEGESFSQHVFVASFSETLAWLKKQDLKPVAVTKEGETVYYQADLSGALALVFGSESSGLSKDWLNAASGQIAIPMAGAQDSLNLSVSVAIAVFESIRQNNVDRQLKKE